MKQISTRIYHQSSAIFTLYPPPTLLHGSVVGKLVCGSVSANISEIAWPMHVLLRVARFEHFQHVHCARVLLIKHVIVSIVVALVDFVHVYWLKNTCLRV